MVVLQAMNDFFNEVDLDGDGAIPDIVLPPPVPTFLTMHDLLHDCDCAFHKNLRQRILNVQVHCHAATCWKSGFMCRMGFKTHVPTSTEPLEVLRVIELIMHMDLAEGALRNAGGAIRRSMRAADGAVAAAGAAGVAPAGVAGVAGVADAGAAGAAGVAAGLVLLLLVIPLPNLPLAHDQLG